MSVCTAIKKLKEIDSSTDILQVTIDSEVKAYMIFSYSESLRFLDREVYVTYRKDIYEGRIEPFINTLTIATQVTTLTREENIKLYCDYVDNNSNVCFEDLKVGETMIGAIMYCVDCDYESSNKAVWMTVKARDKSGRVAKLRLFDYAKEGLIYNGIYIKADIKRTKFGFNVDRIDPMEFDFPPNPEIAIAETYIRNHFAKDSVMLGVMERTNLLEHMSQYISVEKGYELVRLAIQLDILHNLKNSFKDVDFVALDYALVMQYGYITKSQIEEYSPSLRSVVYVLQQNLEQSIASKVLLIVDPGAKELTKERMVFDKIVDLSNIITRIKKEV